MPTLFGGSWATGGWWARHWTPSWWDPTSAPRVWTRTRPRTWRWPTNASKVRETTPPAGAAALTSFFFSLLPVFFFLFFLERQRAGQPRTAQMSNEMLYNSAAQHRTAFHNGRFANCGNVYFCPSGSDHLHPFFVSFSSGHQDDRRRNKPNMLTTNGESAILNTHLNKKSYHCNANIAMTLQTGG